MRVTFDSNVWQQIAIPSTLPNDPSEAAFAEIRAAIKGETIIPCLSETVFTLEAIGRGDRRAFLADYRLGSAVGEKSGPDNRLVASLSLGPPKDLYAKTHPKLANPLKNAVEARFRLMRCPRVGGIRNPG